jgi:tetratricopeptide (TPR) repeat protein
MPGNTGIMIACMLLLHFAGTPGTEAGDRSIFMDDTAMATAVKHALDEAYSFRPENAQGVLERLREEYPDHPVTPFFEGLVYYWKYYPMIPGKKYSKEFEEAMQRSWRLAEQRLVKDPYDIDGVFFNLTARSFIVMYFADNGKPYKAIAHIKTIYREILKGMDLKESFREFYFLVGLYNYYVEAWPEAYPVYKPVTLLLKDGNKEAGLDMLHWASQHTLFHRGEASMFLSLIYLNFEQNIDSARAISSRLYRKYPENPYYAAKYAEILLLSEEYDKALEVIEELSGMDAFSRMRAIIYRGVYEEKAMRNYTGAAGLYRQGLDLSGEFGPLADYTRAHAYIGLSRYYNREGDNRKAKYYYRKARDSTGYEYLFKDDRE